MKLNARQVETAKPKDKAYKLADGGGLYLLVNTNGSRYWRLKYRFAGKEKLLAVGVYPDVSLAVARVKRDEAKKIVAGGGDPGRLLFCILWCKKRLICRGKRKAKPPQLSSACRCSGTSAA
ncbi:Arm DNA-binding domain-containing protein, partial [Yersinia pseudotuberculosis]|uniref:Arm DNA-binding domain-containing protein n=1 Tax=Yersinia pseudotuberculosis TaxID=633 RepID=UPI000A4D8A41